MSRQHKLPWRDNNLKALSPDRQLYHRIYVVPLCTDVPWSYGHWSEKYLYICNFSSLVEIVVKYLKKYDIKSFRLFVFSWLIGLFVCLFCFLFFVVVVLFLFFFGGVLLGFGGVACFSGCLFVFICFVWFLLFVCVCVCVCVCVGGGGIMSSSRFTYKVSHSL